MQDSPANFVLVPVLGKLDRAIYTLLSLLGGVLIAAFAIDWISSGGWRPEPVPYVLGTALVSMLLFNQIVRWALIPLMRQAPALPAPEMRAAVVTAFVPEAEPLEMLELSLKAMVALDYPHDTW